MPAAALAVALSESTLNAAPPVALVSSTVRAAALLAAGETVLATPAATLMKGALQTMFIRKMKAVTATAVVLLTLGVGGLAYRAGGQTAPAEKPGPKRPLTELEALRRENQLLKLNLEVVLEKVASLDAEVRALRGKAKTAASDAEQQRALAEWAQQRDRAAWAERMLKKGFLAPAQVEAERARLKNLLKAEDKPSPKTPESNRAPGNYFEPTKPGMPKFGKFQPDLVKQAEDALRALREGNPAEQRKAADALEKALRSLRGKEKPGDRKEYPLDKQPHKGPPRN